MATIDEIIESLTAANNAKNFLNYPDTRDFSAINFNQFSGVGVEPFRAKQPGNYDNTNDGLILTLTTDTKALTQAANDPKKHQRISAALNYHTPPDDLLRLIEDDDDADVRKEAADNPYTPPGALAKAAVEDSRMEVRRNAVRNPNTPLSAVLEALENALENDDWYIIKAVAENSQTPREALTNVIRRLADRHLFGEKNKRNDNNRNQISTDGYFSAAELAERYDKPVERIKKRLEAWRRENLHRKGKDWIENPRKGGKEASYLYRESDVNEIVRARRLFF
ncbi:hypothetical protein FACS1894107_14050 [Planctomycetales bacterium]|nr:hypothetical protein FACS1894107_14050 [Planctomycetales bacterium]